MATLTSLGRWLRKCILGALRPAYCDGRNVVEDARDGGTSLGKGELVANALAGARPRRVRRVQGVPDSGGERGRRRVDPDGAIARHLLERLDPGDDGDRARPPRLGPGPAGPPRGRRPGGTTRR